MATVRIDSEHARESAIIRGRVQYVRGVDIDTHEEVSFLAPGTNAGVIELLYQAAYEPQFSTIRDDLVFQRWHHDRWLCSSFTNRGLPSGMGRQPVLIDRHDSTGGDSMTTNIKTPAVHDGFAVAALVLGICWVFGIGSILAVIFGAISMHHASAAARQSSGLAIAGLVLGIIGSIIFVIFWVNVLTGL
jgi:hypothetical protein